MAKNITHILYHISVILLSAALAFSVPFVMSSMAGNLLKAWAYIEDEKMFLITVEIFIAVILILSFNAMTHSLEYRRIARMASSLGLVLAIPSRGIFVNRKMKRMKNELGFARELMIIGSTGYHSFLDPKGDLHEAVQNCRDAKIMLLNPFKEGVITRAMSIRDPEITPEIIRGQIIKSINFIKGLCTAQKQIRLKLYPFLPILKLVIVGDYAFTQHYNTDLNIRCTPEYAFQNDQKHGGFYIPLYHYFISKWQNPDIPEYDLATDELIYRDKAGNEIRREPFGDIKIPKENY